MHFLFALLPANCHSGVVSKIHVGDLRTGFDNREGIDKPLQPERNVIASQEQLDIAIQGQFPGMAGVRFTPSNL